MTAPPEAFVLALGRLALAVSDVESAACRLFGEMLQLRPAVAEAVFYAPKNTITRLELVEYSAPLTAGALRVLAGQQIVKAIRTAKVVVRRRNGYIHGAYSVDDAGDIRHDAKDNRPPAPITAAKIIVDVENLDRLARELLSQADLVASLKRQP